MVDDASDSVAADRQIDAVCDDFEQAFIRGQSPQIEAFLSRVAPPLRLTLLVELLRLEVELRIARGQQVAASDYATRFPELSLDQLDEILNLPRGREGAATVERLPDVPLLQPTILSPSDAVVVPGVATSVALPRVRYFGDYELIREIARGGMGVVYEARQRSLNRPVALKMILAGQLARPEEVTRFRREAEAAAQLEHPGIVPIFEIGTHGDQHYFTMGYVAGPSLSARLLERPLEPREAAALLRDVALAVQYAHERGVVHRDLKPSNILLSPRTDGQPGELSYAPRVTDFGLAKLSSSDQSLTETGQILGTPSYMPPEQAAGQLHTVGPAADVYSLGAVLYACLTGRPPFQAASTIDTVRQVMERDPVSLRELNVAVPRDLETLCLKCLEKSIPRRYQTAQAIADELQRYLDGRPILARPVSRRERAGRWCKRNPALAGLISAVAFSLLMGTAVSSYFAWLERQRAVSERLAKIDAVKQSGIAFRESNRAREEAERAVAAAIEQRIQRNRADHNAAIARRHLYAAQLNLAQQAGQMGEIPKLLELLVGLRPLPGQDDLRSFEWYHLWRQCHGGHRGALRGHLDAVSAIAISPDGTQLASGSHDTTIRFWNLKTGEQLGSPCAGTAPVRTVAFSPDGMELASGTLDGLVAIWNVGDRSQRAQWDAHAGGVSSVAFSSDGRTLASGSLDKTVKLWDVETTNARHTFTDHTLAVNTIRFSPDGNMLASAGDDLDIRLWNLRTLQPLKVLGPHRLGIRSIAFTPDGKTIAAGGWDQQVTLWDVSTGQTRNILTGQTGGIMSLAFSPNGKLLAMGTWERTMKLWDLTLGREKAQGHLGQVLSVVFSPDSTLVAAAGMDREIQLWDLSTVEERMILKQGAEWVSVSADSKTIAAASHDGVIKLWDAVTGRERCTLQPRTLNAWNRAHGHPHAALAFSTEGNLLVSGGPDELVKLWDIESQSLQAEFRGHAVPLKVVAFSRNQELVASGDIDGVVKLWDVRRKIERFNLEGHRGEIQCVEFSPDGSLLATTSTDGTSKVWSSTTGLPLKILQEQRSQIGLAFSPCGKTLAITCNDGTVALWDTITWTERMTMRAHASSTMRAVFSPDGKTLATGSEDRSVKLWDPVTGQERMVLRGPGSWVRGLRFAPDGSFLVSSDNSSGIILWRAATSDGDGTLKPSQALRVHFDYVARGQANLRRGQFPQALADFSMAVQQAPDQTHVINQLAWFLITCPDPQFQNLTRAMDLARVAIKLNPRLGESWTMLGAAQYRAASYTEAVHSLTRATELNGNRVTNIRPFDMAFLAMAEFRTANDGKAREVLSQWREVLSRSRWQTDPEVIAIRREAEELIDPDGKWQATDQPGTNPAGEVAPPVDALAPVNRLNHLPPAIDRFHVGRSQGVEDAILCELLSQQAVGAAVGVITNGELTYLNAFGLADRERQRPMTVDSRVNWSYSSQFLMAVLAMQLIQEGKLRLDETVDKFGLDLPPEYATITIRHLLCHQSGLPGYSQGQVLGAVRNPNASLPRLDPVTSVDRFNRSQLVFSPGTAELVGDYGYILLSAIVQRVAGADLADHLRQRIIQPLQLTSLELDGPTPRESLTWAAGYQRTGDAIVRAPEYAHDWKHGAGGYKSNIRDYARFMQAFLNDELLTAESRVLMSTPQLLSSGAATTMAFSARVSRSDGQEILTAKGNHLEASSHFTLIPAARAGVVVLTNCRHVDSTRIADAIQRALNER